MTEGSDNASPIVRLTWMLYQDVNTRFNLLIDECAHLQNTIYAYLPQTSLKDIVEDPEEGSQRHTKKERGWVKRIDRTRGYYRLPAQEASLLHLFSNLGAMALGLEKGQVAVRARFERYIKAVRSNNAKEELYWFLSLRGNFVNDAFSYYLKQVQHSHEMLVQLIENKPGTLPGPLLMRRWASAAYGEFLTAYSRQVNWEVQDYLWRQSYRDMNSNAGKSGNSAFEKWKSAHYLTHSWSHEPTSLARTFSLASNSLKFHTVWSAYFYLEQPILLPLLYHECAHEYLKEENFSATYEDDHGTTYYPLDQNILFERKQEVAETLSRTFAFEGFDGGFWTSFTDEVWADLISVRLCGVGYLTALMLQILGASGVVAYSRFVTELDTNIPLDEIGSEAREIREVQYPIAEMHYFWEARLMLAVSAVKKFFPHRTVASTHSNDSNIVDAISALIAEWNESGRQANSERATSNEHKAMWEYRIELNKWAADVCESALEDIFKEYTKTDSIKPACSPHDLDKPVREVLEASVEAYQNRVLKIQHPIPIRSEINRLEDVCVAIRWTLAEVLATRLITTDFSCIQDYTDQYASYLRSDGSAAFRICYEWMEIRSDIAMAVVDWLDSEAGQQFFDRLQRDELSNETGNAADSKTPVAIGHETYQKLVTALKDDVRIYFNSSLDPSRVWSNERLILKELIAKRSRVEKDFLSETNFDPQHIRGVLQGLFSEFSKTIERERDACPDSAQVPVGTMTFGLLQQFRACPDKSKTKSAYYHALTNAKGYFDSALASLKLATQKPIGNAGSTEFAKSSFEPNFGTEFFPLIGDYSFMTYLSNNTPVERDCHPVGLPKFLAKPRAVMCVLGTSQIPNKPLKYPGVDGTTQGYDFGRIAQLRFKYRWEWLELANKLKQEFALNCPSLFLSSGWEDVILIIWFKNEAEWIEISKSIGLSMQNNGVDVHTNVIVNPKQLEKMIAPTFQMDAVSFSDCLTHPDVDSNIAYRGRRTGRYDLTLVWRKPDGMPLTVMEFWKLYAEQLPDGFWTGVEQINTYFEEREKPLSCDTFGKKGEKSSLEIVSQLVLKH